MIVEKAFLDKLKEFGLNSYESKLWTALLSRGVSTAGELADISGVPRSRSYDVLESLEKKGFINVKSGKPIKYVAVSPSEVIDRVRSRLGERTDEQLNTLESLKSGSEISDLNDLHKQGLELVGVGDLSGNLKGRDNVYHHLAMMVKNAQNSVNIMTSSSGLSRKHGELKTELDEARKRGVKVRIVAPQTKANKEIFQKNSALVRQGEIDNFARFCVADNKEVMLMLFDDSTVHKSYDSAVWISAPYFAKTLNSLFDTAWN